MNTEDKIKLMTALAALALLLVIVCWWRNRKSAEDFAMAYPFGPIDPKQVVPWDTQSVYGLPSNAFELGNCNYAENQNTCATKTLNIVEAQQNFADHINVDFVANDAGQPGQVGAGYLLSIADVEPRFWSWL